MKKSDTFTIIGASGFLGNNLVKTLAKLECKINQPARDDLATLTGDLGIIIYAAGYGVCKDTATKQKVLDGNFLALNKILVSIHYQKLNFQYNLYKS